MLYILGLDNHFYQFFGINNTEYPRELYNYITDFINENGIDLIAEELTDDYCETLGCVSIVCEDVIENSNEEIEHRFVELNDQEREELNIASEDHSAREEHWFDEIEDALKNNWDILFVCGNAHVDSFKELVEGGRYNVKILNF
ncbi:MAG: hypothetical protein BA863_18100 [Desulfovibrio sp. S3730MH75]|nr:MAG: hypothetical protein BA863_18100 [Desulfovibrio sp. S3730MH75]